MTLDQAFGDVVRGFRAAAGLTQAELADRAAISERAVSDIERGLRTRVYPVTARSLADALQLVGDQREWFQRAARSAPAGGDADDKVQPAPWTALRRDPLVGRVTEVDATTSALRSPQWRLVTLTGPGGIGKSRVAAEVCAGSDLRVLWVQLADLPGAEAVAAAIARAAKRPADASPAAVATALDAEPTLLVLDTFERLLDAADQVAALLDRTRDLRVLVTSRTPLRIRGEREITIRPLSLDPAAQLFRQRALASGARLPESGDAAAAVGDIVATLSGLPLAIELAAAQLRHLPLSALRAELAHPLDVLGSGGRELPARHRAIRTTIEWSFDLLQPDDRELFGRLGRFGGPWTVDDAGALVDQQRPHGDSLAAIGRLCEHALVQPEERVAPGGEPRWRLLDPVREFAWERCVSAGAAAATKRRHALRVLHVTEDAAPRLLQHDQAIARATLREAAANVRLALRWALEQREVDVALRLSAAMWMSWRMEGAFTEGRGWVDQALALPGAEDSSYRADALWAAAWLGYHQRDFDRAAVCGQQLQALATSTADSLHARNAATILGEVAMAQQSFPEAVELLSQAVELATAADAPWHRATSLLNLGTALLHAGHPERAEPVLLEAIAAHEQVGDQHFAARSTIEAGYAALVGGDLTTAADRLAAGLRRFMAVAEQWGTAEAIMGLAVLAAARGEFETAATLAGATDAAYADLAVHLAEPDAVLADRVLAQARAAADEASWSAAWADGRTLSIEDAAAIALDRLAGQPRR